MNPLNIEAVDTDPPMDVTKPIIEEISAAGSNSTPVEALKPDIKVTKDVFRIHFRKRSTVLMG